ncbi:MAG: hypothetical protein JJU34_15065 [Lunatimonas sp.]|uniref:DUF4221 family protein n=1 Tax=Lunatimonas sp. TaxID=2060141 RepID=UPI00263A5547|nr:DUF4221 family protein [Lunatimonas sp.]MCC5938599.1 hypothetical protein [Lunatimonas sp.]
MRVSVVDLETGDMLARWDIPKEGPESMKQFPDLRMPLSLDTLFAASASGRAANYDTLGNKIREIESNARFPNTKEAYVRIFPINGLMFRKEEEVYVGLNPYNLYQEAAPSDYAAWMMRLNMETGLHDQAYFRMPSDYVRFSGDLAAFQTYGGLDQLRGEFWFGYPYSDTLVMLRGLKEIKRLAPKTNHRFTYLPSELRDYGSFKVWLQPKEASSHLGLLYDEFRDLFLMLTKLGETGDGDNTFERTKHYLIRVFDGDWTLKGEFTTEYPGREELKDWFITRNGLFINAAFQDVEDEYRFDQVDLSSFSNPR